MRDSVSQSHRQGMSACNHASTVWQTPLGEVAADADMGARLLRRFPALQEDSAAHRAEHAIEVQLPFLQMLRRR